jgi:TRAP-type C4-dicarboxylate transport system permease small subunit
VISEKLHTVENGMSIAVLALMTAVPIADVMAREFFGHSLTGTFLC